MAFFAPILALLGLLAVTPAASAAVFTPSPPTITMVTTSGDGAPNAPVFYQLSPKPGETGFKVLSYDDQRTTAPTATNENLETYLLYAYDESAGAGSGKALGSAPLGTTYAPMYVHARMNVILGDGASYTTPWSPWTRVDRVGSVESTPCGSVQFVGVRGSGETKNDAGGYGSTVASVKSQVERGIPGTVSTAINYPAIGINPGKASYTLDYIDSVETGGKTLWVYLKYIFRTCPNTPVVLVGYSQGAHVVGDIYTALSASERKHIVSVILLGDPRFNSAQPSANAGNYNPKLNGIYTMFQAPRVFPRSPGTSVRSYCAKGDPICSYTEVNAAVCYANPSRCAHLNYVSLGWTHQAAREVVSRLKQVSTLH